MNANDRGGRRSEWARAGRLGAIVVSVLGLLCLAGCDDLSQAGEAALQAEALKTLEKFLEALKNVQLETAHDCLSRAQQQETPLEEFIEGYQAGTIILTAYEIEGIGLPEPEIEERYRDYRPFLVPKGTLTLEAVKNDGLTAPGQKRRIIVPLSWILMVWQGDAWHVQGKGWGPLHTVAFFGRPEADVEVAAFHSRAMPRHYQDDARRYQITPAANWVDRSKQLSLASLAGYSQTRPIALIQRSGAAQPNLTIQTYDASRHRSVQSPMDYATLARSGMRGTELRAPRRFSHDTLTGVRWEYAYSNGLATVHSVTDYYLDGRTIIMVSSTSRPDRFEQDKKEILPMLDSFRFTPKATASQAGLLPNR